MDNKSPPLHKMCLIFQHLKKGCERKSNNNFYFLKHFLWKNHIYSGQTPQ
jgi:hypothetical protein